jgi:hypothetical protein
VLTSRWASALVLGTIPVAGLFWSRLAEAASVVRPEGAASVVADGLVCFGPLGVPLLAVGAVVVWLEEKS